MGSHPRRTNRDALPIAEMESSIRANFELFRKPGVIGVRAGYQFSNGWITRRPAIVVVVRKKDDQPPGQTLPRRVAGFAVDVKQAEPKQQLYFDRNQGLVNFPQLIPAFETTVPTQEEEVGIQAQTQITYTSPTGFPLNPVRASMSVTCAVSPDAGFPTLRDFLAATGLRLTVGMYEFSIRHIVNALFAGLDTSKKLKLVLDSHEDPGGDISEPDLNELLKTSLSNRMSFAWAAVKGRKTVTKWIFPSAYHIKVAVRDGKAFWLSSGNWTRSSLPDNPTANWPTELYNSNREWHLVVTSTKLAKTFEAYLKNDFSQAASVQTPAGPGIQEMLPNILFDQQMEAMAEPGPPIPAATFNGTVKVQPLLTPDNFTQAMIDLVRSAQQSFFMQTQYINPTANSPSIDTLVDALIDRVHAGVDVRIILRSNGAEAREMIEKLQNRGLDSQHLRLQNRVHNKGILIDDKKVVVGSQNWSEPGVTVNRDASLLIDDARIAGYFKPVFLHDWNLLARQQVLNETALPLIASAGTARTGKAVMSWAEYYAD